MDQTEKVKDGWPALTGMVRLNRNPMQYPPVDMTLRQWYAGMAPEVPEWFRRDPHPTEDPRYPHTDGKLQWCLGCRMGTDCRKNADCDQIEAIQKKQEEFKVFYYTERMAAWRFCYADAMISEGEKKGRPE